MPKPQQQEARREVRCVYTAEDIGSKPSPHNFEYMIENLARLGIAKEEILHTAESMFHDHGPANEFGLDNCWIYRRSTGGYGATMNPGDMLSYDVVFNSMTELVAAHKAEVIPADRHIAMARRPVVDDKKTRPIGSNQNASGGYQHVVNHVCKSQPKDKNACPFNALLN